MVKAYITAHVITKGIQEIEGDYCGGAFRYADTTGGRYSRFAFAPRNDCFLNRKDAIARADEIKQKRLVSLREQIERLEKLSFD